MFFFFSFWIFDVMSFALQTCFLFFFHFNPTHYRYIDRCFRACADNNQLLNYIFMDHFDFPISLSISLLVTVVAVGYIIFLVWFCVIRCNRYVSDSYLFFFRKLPSIQLRSTWKIDNYDLLSSNVIACFYDHLVSNKINWHKKNSKCNKRK